MSSIVIEFESQTAYDEMVRCVAIANGYQDVVPDPENPDQMIPNPQSKEEFTESVVAGFLTEKQYSVQLSEKRDLLPPPDSGIVPAASRKVKV